MEQEKKKVNKSSQNHRNTQGRAEFSMNTVEDQKRIDTDPFGSYTGVPNDPFDLPIQDADDL